jgi:hypothetical protein
MRNLKPLIAAMVLVAPAAGAYWWVTSNKELMWALTRGSVNKTSSSTAPYEVALRLARKDGIPFADGVPAKEWILRLPRTFVTREMGANGSIFRTDERQYFVDIDLNVEADGQSFKPSVGQTSDQLVIRSLQLSLRNDDALKPIRQYNLCVPQDKNEEILRPHGEYGYNRVCSDRDLRCQIDMHVDGWWLNVAVTQDLYANPDKACALARKFLDQHTVKRDELR